MGPKLPMVSATRTCRVALPPRVMPPRLQLLAPALVPVASQVVPLSSET